MRSMPCKSEAECPLVGGPRMDTHHEVYPACDYTSEIERMYRNLGSNIVRICRCQHMELHRTEEPPVKPPMLDMLQAVVDEQYPNYQSVRKKKIMQNILRIAQ